MNKKTICTVCLLFVLVLAPRVCLPSQPMPDGIRADKVIIDKGSRLLMLLSNGKVIKTYKVALGRCPEGPKLCAGDGRTPEGEYFIDSRQTRSKYYKALHISYPNSNDLKRARQLGVKPGGNIEIHGIGEKLGWLGEMHQSVDWTRGCIAVTNEEIEEIFLAVPDGTMVEIRP